MRSVFVLVLLVIPACLASACSPIISSLAGNSSTKGFVNSFSGENAFFNRPRQMVLDPDTGDLYVADSYNFAVRKVNSFGSTSTLYISSTSEYLWGIAYNRNPKGLFMTLTHSVNFYDLSTNAVTQITADPSVTYNGIAYDTFSNRLYVTTYTTRVYSIQNPLSGAPTVQLLFSNASTQSWGILGYNSNLYFGTYNKLIKFNLPGSSSTVLAGASTPGYNNGVGSLAQFSYAVSGFALAPNNGAIYVADFYNSLIRRVEFDGTTSTAAGVYQTTTFTPSSSSYGGSFGQCAVVYAHPLIANFYYVSDEFGVRSWYWSPPLISNIASSFLTSPSRLAVTWVNFVPTNTIDSFTLTVLSGSAPAQVFNFAGNNTYVFSADPAEKHTITLVANNIFGPSNTLSLIVG